MKNFAKEEVRVEERRSACDSVLCKKTGVEELKRHIVMGPKKECMGL